MTDNMDYAPIGGLQNTALHEHPSNVQSALPISADNAHYTNSILSEVRNPPVGGVTGDTSGRCRTYGDVLAKWTCEDCPDPYADVRSMQVGYLPGVSIITKVDWEGIDWGGIYSHTGWSDEYQITAWPQRCTDCDTRFRKHKRTSKAIRAVFYHPSRMYKFEDQWVFVPKTKYRHIKLITLEHPTPILKFSGGRASPLEQLCCEGRARGSPALCGGPPDLVKFANHHLSELKEKFRRLRKRSWWQDLVLYGRWFAEVTWTVHYSDGSKSKPTQWMPSNKELEGAVEVSIHPHLHVVAAAKYMDKEQLTDWWDYGTHIRATDRWMVCKDYLTKYVNKQQLPGRHQGTFGSLKKR